MKIYTCLTFFAVFLFSTPIQSQNQSESDSTGINDQIKGERLFKAFKFDSGTFYLRKASEVFREKEDWTRYFECRYYINLAPVFLERNTQKALDSLNADLALAKEKMGESGSGVGEIYFGLGWLHDNALREKEKGSDYYHKALQTWESSYGTYHEKTAKAYANYALILISIRKFGKAEPALNKALEVYGEVYPANHGEWARLYNTAFYYYHGLNQLEKASTFASALYQIGKNNKETGLQLTIRSCRNLSIVLYGLQEYELAAKYALEEMELGKEFLNTDQIASIYNNLGRIYWFSDADKTLEFTKKALDLKLSSLGPDDPGTISSQINYASALTDFGSPDIAIPMFKSISAKLMSSDNQKEDGLRSLSLMSKAYNFNQQWQKSTETYRQAEEMYFSLIDLQPEANLAFYYYATAAKNNLSSLIEQFKTTRDTEYLRKAHTDYKTADSLLQFIWKNLEYAADQQSFLNLTIEFYVIASDLFYYLFKETNEVKYADLLLYSSEKNKASISFPAFSLALKMDQLNIPSEILNRKKEIDLSIARLENNPDGDKELLVIKKNERDSLLEEIRIRYPKYYSERMNTRELTIDQIQKNLLPDESLIMYITSESNYIRPESSIISLLVTKDKVGVWRSITDQLPLKIEQFLTALNDREDLSAKSSELYRVLNLDSVEAVLKGQKITIIPNNELFALPFDLITDSSGESFIEKYTIGYLQSGAMMLSKKDKKVVRTASLFAPSIETVETDSENLARGSQLELLYSSVDEIDKINEIIGGSKLNDKSKSGILDQIRDSDIIHFATHAEVSHSSPGSSELFLSYDRESSIYAYELYNQNFNAQLVTLSACNTGIGKLQKGEGIQSLGKAFTYAGCPNIVMSLWPVNDESTAELMTYFYQNLKDGMRKDAALRNAKLTYLENADPVKAHPYYWAGFVFSGNPEALEFESGNTSWWLFAIPLLVIVAIAGRKRFYSSSSS
ncbi:MAG: CHAT domain-containing tetratricopeptide repeat protein [Cyclobacteriaceae bacterium]